MSKLKIANFSKEKSIISKKQLSKILGGGKSKRRGYDLEKGTPL